VGDTEILTVVMKNIDRRLRPHDIPPTGDFTHTWFKAQGQIIRGSGSFPSGHTITAFSVAAVFARRYRQHRWAPWVAYGLAGLVGFSRVTLQSHFPSDVFAGAALGYVISHYIVLRRD
jgi:membrane-associated phospholipid phosphatase